MESPLSPEILSRQVPSMLHTPVFRPFRRHITMEFQTCQDQTPLALMPLISLPEWPPEPRQEPRVPRIIDVGAAADTATTTWNLPLYP